MGEMGNGTQDQSNVGGEDSGGGVPSPSPYPVVDTNGKPIVAKSLAVNHGHSCAVVGDTDHPWCWGNNLKGQAGITVSFSPAARPIYSCGF
jgi:hypothetical protein